MNAGSSTRASKDRNNFVARHWPRSERKVTEPWLFEKHSAPAGMVISGWLAASNSESGLQSLQGIHIMNSTSAVTNRHMADPLKAAAAVRSVILFSPPARTGVVVD